jgi:glycosyltransferase involved in cell wall biosynthesis
MSAVSIAIPCHNHWQFLDECLASLVAQTHTDWEAIVVDDGSTKPASEPLLARWNDPRIHWLRNERALGPAAARNRAIQTGRHAILVTLDADDALCPAYLATLLAALAAEPELDCVFPDFEFFGVENHVHEFREREHSELARWQYLPAQVMMRRTLWLRAGGYCEDPALPAGNEDWDFWLAAAGTGYRAAHVAQPLYRYRTQAGSLSHRLRAVDHLSREFMYRRHRVFLERYTTHARFVGPGYWRSAEAVLANGHRLKALPLLWRASRFAPDVPRLRNFFRQMLPLRGPVADHGKRPATATGSEP